MGRIVNTLQLVDKAIGNINSRYDIYSKNVEDIANISNNYQNPSLFNR